MKLRVPTIEGIIRRRILLNYRVDPEVMQAQVPAPFRVHCRGGHAIGGICLIRLDGPVPPLAAELFGFGSENALHRVAVEWDGPRGPQHGTYIRRRDTDSLIKSFAGGRLFPGRHHRATFDVEDTVGEIRMTMKSADDSVRVHVRGVPATRLPSSSIFGSLDDASSFLEGRSVGYSESETPAYYDGLEFHTERWAVHPMSVFEVQSSWFDDRSIFPEGCVAFDHGLIMRDVEHEWRRVPGLTPDGAVSR